MDATNSKGLWLHYEPSSSPMWQWECHNPCEHSRTKHIDIRHHFLRDHAIKGDTVISHVRTNKQLADIFTKPLDERRFCELRNELNIIDSRNVAWGVAHRIVASCFSLFGTWCQRGRRFIYLRYTHALYEFLCHVFLSFYMHGFRGSSHVLHTKLCMWLSLPHLNSNHAHI